MTAVTVLLVSLAIALFGVHSTTIYNSCLSVSCGGRTDIHPGLRLCIAGIGAALAAAILIVGNKLSRD